MNDVKEFITQMTAIFPAKAMIAAVAFVVGMVWYSLRGRKS